MPRGRTATLTKEEVSARRRDVSRRWAAEASRASANIGELPTCKNPNRKIRCRYDLHSFLVEYFPSTTGMDPFSAEHIRAIKRIEQCLLRTGRFVNAFPRGFAKTTISQNSAIWACVYGHRRFIAFFAGDQILADNNLASIKKELSTNTDLQADFPEVCYPIAQLEGSNARTQSQHIDGARTYMQWKSSVIVMPTVAGSDASGTVLVSRGLTAGSRGMVHKRESDGVQQRPDAALIDDPQTDESAASPVQTKARMDIIKRAILKLGGHKAGLACVINATVIQEGDLVDQLLDVELNAAWQGERIPFLKQMPDKLESMWLKNYAEIRRNYSNEIAGDQIRAWREASAYYAANREEMDRGSIETWKYAYEVDNFELSATQRAVNVIIDDGQEVFDSELQNDPKPDVSTSSYARVPDIIKRVSGYDRNQVPERTEHLVAYVDVQKYVLFYVVTAMQKDFTCRVIDYGTYPPQNRRYYTLRNLSGRLDHKFPDAGDEGRIRLGLNTLVDETLMDRMYRRVDDVEMQIELLMIDANYGMSTDLVYVFSKESRHRTRIMPSHGKYYGAATIPISDKRNKRKQGEIVGQNWFIPAIQNKGDRPHVIYDTNFWKSFLHSRLCTAIGDPGALTLFNAPPHEHRLFAEHCNAEFPVHTFGRGRELDEWKERPSHPDNHFFDCVVGTMVAGSRLGCSLVGEGVDGEKRRRKKVSLKR